MKRRIATLVLAMPLMAGGICLAEQPMAGAPDSQVQAPQDQKVVTKRVSKLIGQDVYNKDGKEIGEIKDVVFDGNENRISYVVVSYGGIMGLGDKYFALPYGAFESRSVEPDKLFINISEDTLKNAPGFDKSSWPNMADPAMRAQIDTHYNVDHKSMSDMKHDAHQAMNDMKNDANHAMNGDKNAAAMNAGPVKKGLPWARRASAVIGADVRSPANENLGDIEDLVINTHTGVVQYAVLSFGGVMGLGDKLFAIPMGSLQTKADDDKFVLDVPKDRLKAAPGFNKDNWPDFADAQFRSNVDQYYNNRDANKSTEAKTE
ncbi:hypothetical protein BH10PLA1_BH10PLA1_14680 [soil metagenome]